MHRPWGCEAPPPIRTAVRMARSLLVQGCYTMTMPRLLDLFCCEGGAAKGYADAGWDIVGVDLNPRFAKRYPYEFVAADALAYLATEYVHFDAVHASPPCQHASAGTRALANRSKYPRLIGPTRELLKQTGLPYVIENVTGADLIDPVWLCGTQFGMTATDDDGTLLELRRHRGFETNWNLTAPGPCQHGAYSEWVGGSYGGARRDRLEAKNIRKGGYVPAKRVQQELLGIDWMTLHGMWQSIPPTYSQYIGEQLLAVVGQ